MTAPQPLRDPQRQLAERHGALLSAGDALDDLQAIVIAAGAPVPRCRRANRALAAVRGDVARHLTTLQYQSADPDVSPFIAGTSPADEAGRGSHPRARPADISDSAPQVMSSSQARQLGEVGSDA